MTRQEIIKEMNMCSLKIDQLRNEFEVETEFSAKMAKIDEMIAIADRMSELDSLNKKLILTELEAELGSP